MTNTKLDITEKRKFAGVFSCVALLELRDSCQSEVRGAVTFPALC